MRKARPKFVSGKMYHLYNRHFELKYVFCDSGDVDRFRKAIVAGSRKYHVVVDSFVVMDNHFHILLEVIDGGDGAKFIMSLQRGYAQYYNCKYGLKGRVFEERCKRKVVTTLYYLQNIREYLAMNPVNRVLEFMVKGMVYQVGPQKSHLPGSSGGGSRDEGVAYSGEASWDGRNSLAKDERFWYIWFRVLRLMRLAHREGS